MGLKDSLLSTGIGKTLKKKKAYRRARTEAKEYLIRRGENPADFDIDDMAREYIEHNVQNYYYYYLKYKDKTQEERRKTLVGRQMSRFSVAVNNPANRPILDNKQETYKYFKQYYKREVLDVCSRDDREAFEEFAKRAGKFAVKPKDSYGGAGVSIKNANETSFDKLFEEYNGGFVAEEFIEQAESTAKYHPHRSTRFAHILLFTRTVPQRFGLPCSERETTAARWTTFHREALR